MQSASGGLGQGTSGRTGFLNPINGSWWMVSDLTCSSRQEAYETQLAFECFRPLVREAGSEQSTHCRGWDFTVVTHPLPAVILTR